VNLQATLLPVFARGGFVDGEVLDPGIVGHRWSAGS
jgi:hypothetical protein